MRMYDTIPTSVVPSKDVAKILYGWASAAEQDLKSIAFDEEGSVSFGAAAVAGQEELGAKGGVELDPAGFKGERAAFSALAKLGFADPATMAFSAAMASGQSDRIPGASLPAMLLLLTGDACGVCNSFRCSTFQKNDVTYACKSGRLYWSPASHLIGVDVVLRPKTTILGT